MYLEINANVLAGGHKQTCDCAYFYVCIHTLYVLMHRALLESQDEVDE